MKISIFTLILLSATLLINCNNNEPAEVTAPPPEPLATVDDMTLGVEEFSRRLAADPLTPPLQIVTQWSREVALLAEAYQRKLHLRPDVIQRSREAVEQVLLAELERELTAGVEPPNQRTIKRWWDRHFHSFRVGQPMMRASVFSHISPDSAARVRELLQGNVSESWIQGHMPAVRFHDSGFLYRGELRRELAAFLFDSTATVSGVISVGSRFFVLKRVDEREPEHHFTLTEVEDEIRARLLQQERTRRLATWKSKQLSKINLQIDTLHLVAVAESLLIANDHE